MKIYIQRDRNRLRIKATYEGKIYQFSTGLSDTKTHRAYVEGIANRIELDMISGQFDPTLMKYRPKRVGSNPSGVSCAQLFERFMQHKLNEGVSPRSIETRYKPLLRYLERSLLCDTCEITEKKAKNFKALLLEFLTPQTAKAHLWLLQSAWDWAAGKYNLTESNPWNGLASNIKRQSTQQVKPFTSQEIQTIQGAFRSHRYYSHYYDFVLFLFGTACRFGEAAALRWEHITADFELVWIGTSHSRGYRKGTKTGKARTVVLNAVTAAMLRDRHSRINPNPTDLVFPSPKGLYICDRGFRNRAWITVLTECGVHYRKPYCIRHSVISHALANGANPVELAKQTGHSVKVLLETYAHCIESRSLFVDFSGEPDNSRLQRNVTKKTTETLILPS
jgi:integrase